jgi:Sec-independent protein translocase protein TatA
MDFFGIGAFELVIIFLVAFLVIGPGRMVGFGRTLGRLSQKVRKVSSDFTSVLTKEVIEDEERDKDKGKKSAP